jgi:hypothetical protein
MSKFFILDQPEISNTNPPNGLHLNNTISKLNSTECLKGLGDSLIYTSPLTGMVGIEQLKIDIN